jgi:hypothetical protein
MDYDVWHNCKGTETIIGNIKADTDRKANNLAKKIYGPTVWATPSK